MTRSRSPFSPARAAAVVDAFDVPLDCGICLACLSFVAFAVDGGDERDVAREVRRMTPDLWDEGLAAPALAAAAGAVRAGVSDAQLALADLELRGARSPVARALVRHLAEQLAREMHVEARLAERLGPGVPKGRPEWN